MKLGCTYIKVAHMEKSIYFYENLTNTKAHYSNRNRWVDFPCGISLYCLKYDLDKINSKYFKASNYNEAYMEYVKLESTSASKNMVLNFETADLIAERDRLIQLKIGTVSELMYVNVVMPYWFFIITDPDGNEIEVAGPIK